MMNTIVNEDKITFKDLEQKIFKKEKTKRQYKGINHR